MSAGDDGQTRAQVVRIQAALGGFEAAKTNRTPANLTVIEVLALGQALARAIIAASAEMRAASIEFAEMLETRQPGSRAAAEMAEARDHLATVHAEALRHFGGS